MALAANESWQTGFVRQTDGTLSMTETTAGSSYWTGFVRDADGRLVLKWVFA